MTLYLIGLGLGEEKDITVRGLELVRAAEAVYLEHYTSILGVDKKKLEEFYGREVRLADRDLIEKEIEKELLIPAKEKNIVLLVVGDPFGATTHTDILLRAKELRVKVSVVHNASIMNAIGAVGLELYKFGKTTSIPYWDEGYEPETPYDVIKENMELGLHTLCLLDIKVNEPSKKELRTGTRASKSQPRFMTIQEGLEILQKIEERRKAKVIQDDMLIVGVARLGQKDQVIKAGTLTEVQRADFGVPLHAVVVPAALHVVEREALQLWR